MKTKVTFFDQLRAFLKSICWRKKCRHIDYDANRTTASKAHWLEQNWPSQSNFLKTPDPARSTQRTSARRPNQSLPLSIHFRSAPEIGRHSHKAESAQCRSAPVGTLTMEMDHRQFAPVNRSVIGTEPWDCRPQTAVIDWDRWCLLLSQLTVYTNRLVGELSVSHACEIR